MTPKKARLLRLLYSVCVLKHTHTRKTNDKTRHYTGEAIRAYLKPIHQHQHSEVQWCPSLTTATTTSNRQSLIQFTFSIHSSNYNSSSNSRQPCKLKNYLIIVEHCCCWFDAGAVVVVLGSNGAHAEIQTWKYRGRLKFTRISKKGQASNNTDPCV